VPGDGLLFPADPRVRQLAGELYGHARDLPLICPHGHVDPQLLAEDRPFPDPARLLIVPDHYLTRMLLSQGIPPDRLGVPRRDGSPARPTAARSGGCSRALAPVPGDPVAAVAGAGAGRGLRHHHPLRAETADEIYDALRPAGPAEFRPRALFARFNIEVLATTESPLDDLAAHAKLAADGWGGRAAGHHHVPPGRRGRPAVAGLGRPDRPLGRADRRGHRDLRRLPAGAGAAAGRVHRGRARAAPDHGAPVGPYARLSRTEAAACSSGACGGWRRRRAEAFPGPQSLMEFRPDVHRGRAW
jgi:hypothetical protein